MMMMMMMIKKPFDDNDDDDDADDDDDDDDDDEDDVFLYSNIHRSLYKSNSKTLVYTFTRNETCRAFVNDTSTQQSEQCEGYYRLLG